MGNHKMTLTGRQYKELLAMQKSFCGKDNRRPMLQGLMFESDKDKFRIYALDGYKLDIIQPNYMKKTGEPLKKVVTLPYIKIRMKDVLSFELAEKGLIIAYGNVKTEVRYIEGNPFNIDTMTATKTYYKATFSIKYLQEVLSAYSKNSTYITFEFQKENTQSVKISSENGKHEGLLLPVRTYE